MTILPIGAVSAVTPTLPAIATTSVNPSGGSKGASFADTLVNGLNQLQQLQANADNLSVQAATGALSDPATLMVATTQASLAIELVTAVRDKALDAFNEILRMQA